MASPIDTTTTKNCALLLFASPPRPSGRFFPLRGRIEEHGEPVPPGNAPTSRPIQDVFDRSAVAAAACCCCPLPSSLLLRSVRPARSLARSLNVARTRSPCSHLLSFFRALPSFPLVFLDVPLSHRGQMDGLSPRRVAPSTSDLCHLVLQNFHHYQD